MNKQTVLTVVFFVAFLAVLPSSAAQDCNFSPKELAQGDRREYKGLYENKAYGYSVVIPTNLLGSDGVNPFYQHGFGILLGAEPQSYIFVNGEPNSLEFARPADVASRFLEYLYKHGSKVESSKITKAQLGTLGAARLVATYTCPGTTDQYMRASVVAISPDKSNLYEVTFYARSDRFEQDRAVFDALVKSWKHLRAAHGQKASFPGTSSETKSPRRNSGLDKVRVGALVPAERPESFSLAADFVSPFQSVTGEPPIRWPCLCRFLP